MLKYNVIVCVYMNYFGFDLIISNVCRVIFLCRFYFLIVMVIISFLRLNMEDF